MSYSGGGIKKEDYVPYSRVILRGVLNNKKPRRFREKAFSL